MSCGNPACNGTNWQWLKTSHDWNERKRVELMIEKISSSSNATKSDFFHYHIQIAVQITKNKDFTYLKMSNYFTRYVFDWRYKIICYNIHNIIFSLIKFSQLWIQYDHHKIIFSSRKKLETNGIECILKWKQILARKKIRENSI